MKKSETKHSDMMEAMRMAHATEMDDVRGVLYEERVAHKCEMDDVREVLKETQQRYSLKNVHVNVCTSYRTHFNSTMNQYMAGAMVGGGGNLCKRAQRLSPS